MMKKLLLLTGLAEAVTGIALIVVPALVGRLLLGVELAGVAVVVARVAGIALLALGVGCWPGPAVLGMLTYNALGTVYFARLALGGEWAGPLLWPAVGLHAVSTLFSRPRLARETKARRTEQPDERTINTTTKVRARPAREFTGEKLNSNTNQKYENQNLLETTHPQPLPGRPRRRHAVRLRLHQSHQSRDSRDGKTAPPRAHLGL